MKVYQTKRLFYGKWVYRIETSVPGANLLKHWGADYTRSFCTNKSPSRSHKQYSDADLENLLKFTESVEEYFNKDLQVRTEGSTMSFYLNDSSLYKELQQVVDSWVVSLTEPVNDAEVKALTAKSSLFLCNEYPYEKYQYRVYIRPSFPSHQRTTLLNWLSNYGDSFRPSKTTQRWLEGDSQYFYGPFIHVTDRNHLLMISLFLGSYLKNTEEFVLRNTVK